MIPRDIRYEVQLLIDLLQENDLILDRNPSLLLSLQTPASFISTWSNDVKLLDASGSVATIDEYIYHLRARNFSAVLFDGALVQISYEFQRGDLLRHRLCFYPCPVSVEREDLELFPLDELVLQYSSNAANVRLESPVRFDYDREAAGPDHPASHLHLSRETCRVPVRSPLSVGHFVQFVFMNFYPEIWRDMSFLREWPSKELPPALTDAERYKLHVWWIREDAERAAG